MVRGFGFAPFYFRKNKTCKKIKLRKVDFMICCFMNFHEEKNSNDLAHHFDNEIEFVLIDKSDDELKEYFIKKADWEIYSYKCGH